MIPERPFLGVLRGQVDFSVFDYFITHDTFNIFSGVGRKVAGNWELLRLHTVAFLSSCCGWSSNVAVSLPTNIYLHISLTMGTKS